MIGPPRAAEPPPMPSPFPGMDPFLEKPSDWRDFHGNFIVRVQAQLAAQVRPNFIAKSEEHVYLHELSAEERVENRRVLAGIADVAVKERRPNPGLAPIAAGPAAAAAVAEPTTRLGLDTVTVVEQREPYLRIVDRETREVVTVIELLSPTNKRPGPDRDAFLAKRDRVLASRASYVELDLLRGGPPTPLFADPPGGTYRVVVSRGGTGLKAFSSGRPPADVWLWGLRDPLPVIPVPLKPPHPDAVLDLRAALDRTYDEAAFEDYLHLAPPDPPLEGDDAIWAVGRRRRSSRRRPRGAGLTAASRSPIVRGCPTSPPAPSAKPTSKPPPPRSPRSSTSTG